MILYIQNFKQLYIIYVFLINLHINIQFMLERCWIQLSFISPHYVPKIVKGETSFTCVMKFGGSSVASADRMEEVATLILSFPEERPIVVLSAMGKTTNKLLLVFFLLHFFFSCWFLHYFGLCWLRIVVEEKGCFLVLLCWRESCELWCYQCIKY